MRRLRLSGNGDELQWSWAPIVVSMRRMVSRFAGCLGLVVVVGCFVRLCGRRGGRREGALVTWCQDELSSRPKYYYQFGG